jgi:hypothetical protein
MIGWKFESGKTLNRGHREKTTNQKRKGSGEKTPVQRSAQHKTKGETMKRLTITLLFLALAAIVPAFAEQSIGSAGWLNTNCQQAQTTIRDANDAFSAGICDGFMKGWEDGVIGLLTLDHGKPVQIVVADGVTVGQMERVFISYMAGHPEVENETADTVLFHALLKAGLMGTKPLPVPVTTN